MSFVSYNDFDKRIRDLEIICEQRILKHAQETELKILIKFEQIVSNKIRIESSDIEDNVIENMSKFLDDEIDKLLSTKVIEKCLEVNDNIGAILKSRDGDETVRKFCEKFLRDSK